MGKQSLQVNTSRVNAYIDGWNLYYAEMACKDNRVKWVNLRALCQHFCDENDILNTVYYFTAYADGRNANISKYNNAGSDRQYSYINDFLKPFGVKTVYGYMMSPNKDEKEQEKSKKSQEKYTDVNLSLQMFEDAMYDRFDKAILLSADTDFIPAIKRVIKLNKKVLVVSPNQKKSKGFKLNGIAEDDIKIIDDKVLLKHLLPVENENGIKMPKEYLLKMPSAEEQDSSKHKFQYDYSKWEIMREGKENEECKKCEKCKDYLDYDSYNRIKSKIADNFWNQFIFKRLSFEGL